MKDIDKYVEKARDVAEDAGGKAKGIAVDVVSGAKEKIQGILQDNRAGREIRQGLSQLEALPEVEGSILYKMEFEAANSYLRSLLYIINDNRLDSASVAEELRRVLEKLQPSGDAQAEETEEQQAIENLRNIAYSACEKALEAL